MSATRPPSFDERYAAPVEASRRGAHRARPNPLTSALPVVAGVAVVLLVVVGAWAVLGNRSGSSGSGNPPAAAQPSASAPASAGTEVPVPSVTPSAGASTPAAGEPTPSAGESEGAGGEVDRSHPMRVRSSVSVQGLAKEAAQALKDKGWTGITDVGNANARNLPATLVYYAGDDDKAAAEAVAEDLGYGKVKKSTSNAGDEGLTVVLGKDADQ